MKKFTWMVVCLFCLLVPSAKAQDFETAFRAYLTEDYDTMLDNLRPLAEQDDPRAQALLGAAYMEGKGVAKDMVAAAGWLQLAADKGIKEAQFNIGVLYSNGEGVRQDFRRAAEYYTLAAKQGDPNAQMNLAMLYGSGNGVPADVAKAYMWMVISVENGNQRAQRGVQIIERQAPAREVRKGKLRAQACLSSGYTDCD